MPGKRSGIARVGVPEARKLPRAVSWCVLLCCSWRPALSQQCDASEGLRQAVRQGCIAADQVSKFEGWLNAPSEREAGQALRTGAGAYQCLLSKAVAPPDYACFREILQSRLYGKLTTDQLCLQDRLTRALIALRQVAAAPATAEQRNLDADALDAALNEVLAGYSAARMVWENPGLPASLKLAAVWCLDIREPLPPIQLTEELIDALVEIATLYPDQGRHLGAVLGAVLRPAVREPRPPGLSARDARRLDDAYRLLIGLDRENLAATAHYYLFRKELFRALPDPDWAEPEQIHALLKSEGALRQHLEKWAQFLENRANAWAPFREYSDLLWKLSQQMKDVVSERATWRQLSRQSAEALRRGLALSEGMEAQERVRCQETLVDRVRTYGMALGAAKQYQEVIDFESGFLDESSRTITRSQQCYIYAHLSQAHYALANYREAMEHFALSCEIGLDDLKRLAPR